MADQTITCRDCTNPFQFTEGEQQHFSKLNFSPPIRCKDCRTAKKLSHAKKEPVRNDDEIGMPGDDEL